MNLKRPSMFTMFITIGIILVVTVIIIVIINLSGNKSGNYVSDNMEKIDSIEGENNILVDSDGNKSNISNKLLSKRDVDGFIFDSFDISTNKGVSTISFEIYNSKDEERNLGEYELKVLDEYQNVIGRIVDNAGVMQALSRIEVSLSLKGDIANLSDIQVTKVIYEEI